MKYMFPISDKPVKLGRGDQDTLVKNSVNTWLAYTGQWENWLEKARESMNLYSDNRPAAESKAVEKTEGATRANVRLPVIAQAVDSVVAQQHLANFPQDETFFKLRPKNSAGHEMQSALEQHLQDSFEYIDLMAMAQKDRKALAMAGCIAVWHPWAVCKEKQFIYKRNKIFGLEIGTPKRRQMEITTFEGTAFVPLHIEDVRFDATVDTIRETNIIFRRWMDIEELKDVDGIKNKDDIAPYYDYHDPSGSRKDDYYQDWGVDSILKDTGSGNAKEKCLLYEEWGDFYLNGKCYKNHVLIYSNERVFHYFGPNDADHQMKPFTVCPYVYMPNSLLGKSMTHDIIPMAHAADTTVNQILDNVSITINPAYTYLYNDPGLKEYIKDRDLVVGPGTMIPTASHDAIQPLIHDRQAAEQGLQLYQILKEEIRESSGGVPYATGGNTQVDAERTLGEVEILASGTSTRFQMVNQTYDEMRLKPFIRMCVSNLRQYMTEPIIPIDESPITAESIKEAEFDVNVTGSKSVMSRKKDFDDLMFVMERLIPSLIQNQFAQADGSTMKVNIPGIANELLKLTVAKNLPDLFEIQTPEQVQEELEEQGGITDGFAEIQGLITGGAPGAMGGLTRSPGMEAPQGGGY